jgi:putative hemolysin
LDSEVTIQLFDFIVGVNPINYTIIFGFVTMFFLLCFSALISGSEIAYFSLTPTQIEQLRKQQSKKSQLIIKHLEQPQFLLANILVGNNFVNIGIVVVSSFVSIELFNFSDAPFIGLIFQVFVITFLLLLFGEIIPKVYAHHFSERFCNLMAYPLLYLGKLFKPLSNILISSSNVITKRLRKKYISMADVSDALDIASENLDDEKQFLEGIVRLQRIDVTTIMRPRVDVIAIEFTTDFEKLLEIINESGYSRIPVYEETFDSIKGVLYAKDLLLHLNKPKQFRWQSLIRPPYFIPESKKIDDLLEEFQNEKVHMAIVVDEYGGISGIVTLEDILEEIIGEINDEFDDDDDLYTQVSESTFIFDGKMPLHDSIRIMSLAEDFFDEVKGDADTIAGLILEMNGDFPKLFQEIEYKHILFVIEAGDKRRIKKIKVYIKEA